MFGFGKSKQGPQFKVASCPSQDHARTNCVYLAPPDFAALFPAPPFYLQLDTTFIYTAAPDPSVVPSTVALNAIQRRELRLALADPVELSRPSKSAPIPAASAATFEVDFVKAGAPRAEFDADELALRVSKSLAGFPLTPAQSYVIDMYGTSLLLKVASVALEDEKSRSSSKNTTTLHALLAPDTMLYFARSPKSEIRLKGGNAAAVPKEIFKADFNFEKLGIGGLDKEFSDIFRRAFASRVFPPTVIQKLGISHVKGMLLYGPPGTGKTLIARQIGKMLNGKEPKVVNGPEILNKYVGQSEENIRNLFKDAEAEYAERGESSDLHIIIFDEIDAICKQRGTGRDGTGVGDTVVNQLLSKIDGVNSLNNILVIGMTNRKDMIDEALLRPGRLEVHVEISLPDEHGRQQILRIHTAKMRDNNMLGADVSIEELAASTKNYSGAEIEGLCKSAAAFALNRNIDHSNLTKPMKDAQIVVRMADFQSALGEVKPAFGMGTDAFARALLGGFINHGIRMTHLLQSGRTFREEVQRSSRNPLLSVLIEGPPATGKTALAAKLAIESGFPFVRMISPEQYVGYSEPSKCMAVAKVFDDAHKSPLSVLVIDNIERLIEFAPIGPRYSNTMLQTLLVLIKQSPPKGRKLLVLATTSNIEIMEQLEIRAAFNAILTTPVLNAAEIAAIIDGTAELSNLTIDNGDVTAFESSKTKPFSFPNAGEREQAIRALAQRQIGIKKLLMVLEMVRGEDNPGSLITLDKLGEVLSDVN